jgi:Tryptophan 2,3-dioxygenase
MSNDRVGGTVVAPQIIENLKKFPVLSYVSDVVARGRQAIEPETRKQAAALFDFAEGMMAFETSLDRDARTVLNLARDVLFTEKFLLSHPKPRYVAYTNLRVLNRFLLEDVAVTVGDKWARAKRALALVIRDWHERERDILTAYLAGKKDETLIGLENESASSDRIAHIKERERSLGALSQFAAVQGLSDTRIIESAVHRYQTDWIYFADAPERQIAHLTCLPRSRWHDEYMFLRTTHATECCFAGIIAGLATLLPVIRKRKFAIATEILKGTLYFSDFLTKLFAIFDTMPVAHFFSGFREATGEASAIQSVRFQTIEVLTRGLGAPKKGALSYQNEARFASEWNPPKEATLVGMCEIANDEGAEGSEFLKIAEMFDRNLYKWRARHFGIARKYLPPDSVGTGNEGIPYLDANFKSPRSATGSVEDKYEDEITHENARARITLSYGLRPGGYAPVAVITCSGVTAINVHSAMAEMSSRLKVVIAERENFIQQVMHGYARFFGNYRYPVSHQFTGFQRRSSLPDQAIPALLLSLELKSGGLFGLHDVPHIAGQIVFDTACADESFPGLDGRLKKCADGEPIVRDEHGIIASIFQGPDKRTAVSLPTEKKEASWALLLFGYPSMSKTQYETLVADARETIASIKGVEQDVWVKYDS